MPNHGITEAALAGNLAGFSLGLVISLLLLVLTLRARLLPGTPMANISLAACAILWNAGGLLACLQRPGLLHYDTPSIALAVQFTGAALWPLPVLAVWRHFAVEKWQYTGWRYVESLAWVQAAVVAGGMWAGVAGGISSVAILKQLAAYGSLFLLVVAAGLLLRGKAPSRALLVSMTLVFGGLLISASAMIVSLDQRQTQWVQCLAGVVAHQSLLLVVIGNFFLFARFRFADVLIRGTVRLLLASVHATALVLLLSMHGVRGFRVAGEFPIAGHFMAAAILTTAFLVSFAPLERALSRFVDRMLFHAPDYRDEARRLGDAVRSLYSEADVMSAAESAVRETLALKDARSVRPGALPGWPPEIMEGQVAELACGNSVGDLLGICDVEVLVPIRAAGVLTFVLAIAPGAARRTLVSHEVNYLRNVATQLGTRLDLLRLEREMADRQNREAILQQQVTEAELRALRAQINPHFLFNSLNTVANLIATNPPRAEVMTLRLAKVFRHVLANSSRQMVPVREEIEFLRTYLDIEEARFGNRLHVEIDVSPEVAHSPVPSLILQPVVENALRHGLAPRPGPGRLKISAMPQGDLVCLAVEDDGVGPGGWYARSLAGRREGDEAGGLGLRNIVQRLAALYRDGAHFSIQAAIPEGTRVTLLVPRVVVAETV